MIKQCEKHLADFGQLLYQLNASQTVFGKSQKTRPYLRRRDKNMFFTDLILDFPCGKESIAFGQKLSCQNSKTNWYVTKMSQQRMIGLSSKLKLVM